MTGAERLAESVRALRAELRAARSELRDVSTQLEAAGRRAGQAAALLREEAGAHAALHRLEAAMDAPRASAHISEAVGRAALVEAPLPHLRIDRMFPDDLYTAMVDAVPPPPLFQDRGAALRPVLIPPKLGPTHAMIAWAFALDVCIAALAAAARARLDGTAAPADTPPDVAESRIIARVPGNPTNAPAAGEAGLLTVRVLLARPAGPRMNRAAIAAAGNVAVAFIEDGRAALMPWETPRVRADVEAYVWEIRFRVGSPAQTR